MYGAQYGVFNFVKLIFPVTLVIISTYYFMHRNTSTKWVPVLLWHGMGDSCCNPLSLGKVMHHIKDAIGPDKEGNEVYIASIKIGNNIIEDTLNGYFKNVNEQVEIACNQVKNDPNLSLGYNAIGFSQGAQFLRAVAQRCPEPPMHNLVSIGGQHQGVYGLPHCEYPDHKICDYIRRLLNEGAYLRVVQNKFVQAEYWHDPLNEKDYKEGSIFLADINNERAINFTYMKNLQKLKNIVFVKFNNDSMVQPIETEWFGFYSPGQAVNVTDLWDSQLYKEDRLGLKMMNIKNKLHFLSVNGDHLQFTWEWFEKNIVKPYLEIYQ